MLHYVKRLKNNVFRENLKNISEQLAKYVHVVGGSGNNWRAPGDLIFDTFLVEDKCTKNKSFRITTDIVKKITNEAILRGKQPAITITLDVDSNEPITLFCIRMK